MFPIFHIVYGNEDIKDGEFLNWDKFIEFLKTEEQEVQKCKFFVNNQ